MLKKLILFENKTSLIAQNLQLVIKSEICESTILIEDIGYIDIDHPEVYISVPAINLLVENNIAVIFCNSNHLPNEIFLNLNSHHSLQEIFRNHNCCKKLTDYSL